MSNNESAITLFNGKSGLEVLVPRQIAENKKERALPASYNGMMICIVGIKTTAGRFLPVSHEGDSNETYIDKVELLGTRRVEFIARKQKGIERRAHMRLFRDLTEQTIVDQPWQDSFRAWFGRECEIPNDLCTLCWNDSLFGSLVAGKGATFSRVRYFDSYSLESVDDCVAMLGSEEGMAIGNTVGENLSEKRGDASLHYYEYVKAGTHFPFITIIENATLLDLAGLLQATKMADVHGYGKYSTNHGKFATEVLAVAAGMPHFSVLDMLAWGGSGLGELRSHFDPAKPQVKFDAITGGEAPSVYQPSAFDALAGTLSSQFKLYASELSKEITRKK